VTEPVQDSALDRYRPAPGRFDELTDARGGARPAWAPLLDELASLGPAELRARREMADRLVVAEGAGHLVHDEADDTTSWRIDPVPLILPAAEWRTIERGLQQRAELLEAVLDDLTGPRHLLRGGLLPPAVVLGHPAYQRAAHGVGRPGRPRLVAYGADLVRDATGRHRVLRDVTDVPVGAGHALLNRHVLSRLLPDVMRRAGVEPLDDYFATLRAALAALAPPDRPSPRSVVLTPGTTDPRYVEHSYLAVHLGYNLAEGGDLAVRGGRVWLRSLGGLEPVDVVLRLVPDAAADPLAFGRSGAGGVAGLLESAREERVGVGNALGSGVLANLALQPFLPDLCRHLLGEALTLASLDSYWCGDPEHRAVVLDRLEHLVLHDTDPARATPSVFGNRLSDEQAADWRRRIEDQPHRYVAQEKVDLATTPLLANGSLEPGIVVVGAQVATGTDGRTVLPGGHARIVPLDVPIVQQTSGVAKDVWVVDEQRRRVRVRVTPPDVPQVDLRASLPSRAAEALFWMGRNAERAEAATRAASAILVRAERSPELLELADGAWMTTTLAGLRAITVTDGPAAPVPADGVEPIERLRQGLAGALVEHPGSLTDSVTRVLGLATTVREFLSTATWRVMESLRTERDALAADAGLADLARTTELLDRIAMPLMALAGLAMESTVRGPSWRFLDLGRRLERAYLLLSLLEATVTWPHPAVVAEPMYETVLAACESLVAYRRRYRSDLALDALCDLLLADDTNPRALAFQLDRLSEDVASLPNKAARIEHEAEIAQAQHLLVEQEWRLALPASPGSAAPALVELLHGVRAALAGLDRGVVQTWFAHVSERGRGPR
jgi:uncharacterized circularly permuted ATP-grasp superfamily protein/uncharacterized alpha-E superfamily protein